MSETTKIVLIAGGVAVAAYFVVKVIATPAVVPRGTAPANTGTSFVSGIVSTIGSVANAFKAYAPANAPLAGISSANYVDPNSNIDPSTGGVYLAPGQVYGP